MNRRQMERFVVDSFIASGSISNTTGASMKIYDTTFVWDPVLIYRIGDFVIFHIGISNFLPLLLIL